MSSFLFATASQAQIESRSLPTTVLEEIIQKVEMVKMPNVDVQRLVAEDLANDQFKEMPWRFGENIAVNLGIQTNGAWSTTSNGSRVWRMGIKSERAYHINLTFDQYKLPKGGKLFIYNSNRTQTIGAFTEANNQADGRFGTTLVKGDEMILEYDEPLNPAFQAEIHLSRVTHGYRDAFAKSTDGLGNSGTCNVNVNCPAGIDWTCTKKSVCMLVTNGSGFCTGTLLNNTNQDNAPLVLTANHCYSDPSTWVFWFNWEAAGCTNPATSPAFQSASGATLKARRTDPDFCLVQINAALPTTYDIIYAGWDKSGAVPAGAVAIHHPQGDIKKISFSDSLTSGASGPVTGTNAWHPFWRAVGGVTEPGSSGSSLWDLNHHVIGQLYGGPSTCASTGASRSDYYGKLAISWDGADNTQRLKDWLDPSNLNPNSLDEKGCNGFSLSTSSGTGSVCQTGNLNSTLTTRASGTFTGAIVLTSLNVPAGVTFTINPSTVSPTTATPSVSAISIVVSSTAAAGTYPITIRGTSGALVSNSVYTLVIESPSGVPIPSAPAANAVGISTTPAFAWGIANLATSYDFELAADSTQAARITTQTNLTTTGYTYLGGLSSSTSYYYRVRSKNSCGTSTWSAWYKFTTNNCTTIMSTDVPKTIPTTVATVTSTLTITPAQAQTIASVSVVNVAGTHTYMGDLDFSIIPPAGTAILLKGRTCAANQNFSFSFDDAAPTTAATMPCTPSPVGQGGTYRPNAVLSGLINTSSAGTWTMQVKDYANVDGGLLNSWGLKICPVAPLAPDFTLAITNTPSASVCRISATTQTANLSLAGLLTFSGNVTLTATGMPAGVTVSFGANGLQPTSTATATTTATINIANTTAVGTYPITITGTSGTLVHSQTYTLTILDVTPPVTLITPADLANNVTNATPFSWAPIAGVTGYTLEISTSSSFTTIFYTSTGTATSVTVPNAFLPNATYYWRVRATNSCGNSNWTNVRSFTSVDFNLQLNGITTLSLCRTSINNSATQSLTVTPIGGYSNTVTFSSSGMPANSSLTFASPTLTISGGNAASTNFAISISGAAAGAYTITISATDGILTRRSTFVLNIIDVPTAPMLISPVNQATNAPNSFSFTPVTTVTSSYLYQISNDVTFTNILGNTTATSGSPFSNSANFPFLPGTVYWWRVSGVNVCGTSAWSSEWAFQTPGQVVEIPTTTGIWQASVEQLDAATGYTNYIKRAFDAPQTRQDLLILSIKKDAALVVTPAQVTVTLNAVGGSTRPTNSYKYIQDAIKWYVMNRSWNVKPTTQPTGNVKVKFYYANNDYDGVRSRVPSLNSHDSLSFFKFATGANIDPDPSLGHQGATINNFVSLNSKHGTWQAYHFGEFDAQGFSGGGAGAGSVPIFIDSLVFSGKRIIGANQLNWTSSAERGVDTYILEHSKNGVDFRNIAQVTAQGNSVVSTNYQSIDSKSIASVHTYRLHAVSTSGRSQYAPNLVVISSPDDAERIAKIFPNPTNNDVFISVIGANETVTLRLFNDIGQVIKESTFNSDDIYRLILSDLSNGAYMIQIQSASIDNKTLKVVKID
jgi:subtilisin-like proprotein convertase family protein